jgi:hypothetical protein
MNKRYMKIAPLSVCITRRPTTPGPEYARPFTIIALILT